MCATVCAKNGVPLAILDDHGKLYMPVAAVKVSGNVGGERRVERHRHPVGHGSPVEKSTDFSALKLRVLTSRGRTRILGLETFSYCSPFLERGRQNKEEEHRAYPR